MFQKLSVSQERALLGESKSKSSSGPGSLKHAELTTGTEEIERSHVLTEFWKLVRQDDWFKG